MKWSNHCLFSPRTFFVEQFYTRVELTGLQCRGAIATIMYVSHMVYENKQTLTKADGTLKKVGLQSGAFQQLTTKFMVEDFNPKTPDDPSVKYVYV